MSKVYDLIIIGGGPAGLTAAVYASRFRINTLMIAKDLGGLVSLVHKIENWPGENSISGTDLMNKMIVQVRDHHKVPIEEDEVEDIKRKGKDFILTTKTDKKFEAKSIIICTGTERRKLNVPGEKEFFGKGVSYCATCDAPFYKNKTVGVVGGSDSAAVEALLIAEYAKKVYIIYRKDKLRAEPITTERIKKSGKIEVILNANVKEIKGDKMVKSVILDNKKEIPMEGLFVAIGGVPISILAKNLGAKLDDKEQIITDEESRTSLEGLYAAGDVTESEYKQAIVAASEGAMAAYSAYKYVKKNEV